MIGVGNAKIRNGQESADALLSIGSAADRVSTRRIHDKISASDKRVWRVEDQRFTTGTGEYVADLVLPRAMLWRPGVIAATPRQNNKIDATAAKEVPGVVCVLPALMLSPTRSAAYRPIYAGALGWTEGFVTQTHSPRRLRSLRR